MIYPCSAFRSWAEQDALYNKQDGTTNARGGESLHNYGLAVDFAFDASPESGVQWSWDRSHPWEDVADIAVEMGFTWSGKFKSISGDLGHYENSYGVTLKALQELHKQGGIENVWSHLNKLLKH